MLKHEWSNMTWAEVGDRLRESRLVVFPTGSVEQHGLHLGVGADWIQAWEIARRVGEKSGATVLPVLPYGVSAHHDDFPGVITLDPATYQEVVFEILESLDRDGVTHVVFMNGHGGNLGALTGAAKEAREAFGMLCAIVQWWDILERKPVLGNPAEQHAGYAETALTLASRPEAVRMDHAVLSPTRQVGGEIRVLRAGLAEFRDGLVRIPLKTGDVSDTGSMTEGDPRRYPGTRDYSAVTKVFAEGLMNEVVDWMCAFVEEFEGFELLPIEVSKAKAEKALKT